MTERRALVTGATGFVGRRLIEYLAGRGWEVIGCGVPPGPGVLECDVRDEAQLDAVFDAAGAVSHVFHLAAIAFVPQATREPDLAFSVNIQGTIRLIHKMLERVPRARLLFVSSSEVYGPPRYLPIDEAHPLQPGNPYAISKMAADLYCEFAARAHGLEVVRARPFNHSGAGQTGDYVLPNFARQIAEIEAGQKPPVLDVGNLEAARDFSHVNDVLRAYESLALEGHPGEAYNISSGHAVKIQEALNLLLSMARCSIEVRQDPERMRPSDMPVAYGSSEKLRAHTGWTPEITLESLLQELLEYWRQEMAV